MTDEELAAVLRWRGSALQEGAFPAAADRIKALTAERDEALNQLDGARYSVEVLEKRVAKLMADNARLREALTELLEVSRRAVRLSKEHDNFKLYAMDPMEQSILLSRAALNTGKADT